jgi:hypothetical protein
MPPDGPPDEADSPLDQYEYLITYVIKGLVKGIS